MTHSDDSLQREIRKFIKWPFSSNFRHMHIFKLSPRFSSYFITDIGSFRNTVGLVNFYYNNTLVFLTRSCFGSKIIVFPEFESFLNIFSFSRIIRVWWCSKLVNSLFEFELGPPWVTWNRVLVCVALPVTETAILTCASEFSPSGHHTLWKFFFFISLYIAYIFRTF